MGEFNFFGSGFFELNMISFYSEIPPVVEIISKFYILNQKVDGSVIKMRKHFSLQFVKLEVQANGQAAAYAFLQPLMDLLYGSISELAQICDNLVMKSLLKELWKLVICSLEKNIVLPSVTDCSDISIEGGQGSLTPNQCRIMEQALRVLKEHFHGGRFGLEKDYLNKSEELKSLKNAM